MTGYRQFLPVLLACALLSACGGGGLDDDGGCDGGCAGPAGFITDLEVQQVIGQAVQEARARDARATIAVVDRVGNVLAVYQMNGADSAITIKSPYPVEGGLEDIRFIPAVLGAISKAVTGAYLSSEGNAFSTRTAGQIVQEHFNPGEVGQPSGPLFGVQFSQLACSDLVRSNADAQLGPKRSPLGLSADPGGFPLYKGGTVVGGIGVMADGLYGFDGNLADDDFNLDEAIALAGTRGFAEPADRQGERITLEGKVFRYSEFRRGELLSSGTPPAFGSLPGSLVSVTGYYNAGGGVLNGVAFGQPASGIRADNSLFPGRNAFVLVDGGDNNLYPPTTANDQPGGLTASEVQTLLDQALRIANRSRAQIRRPLGTRARVTIAVVDSDGVTLGVVRSQDAPLFGTDVALQKARTAAFYSGNEAAADIQSAPDANYLGPELVGGVPVVERSISLGDYVTAVRDFTGNSTALADGAFAFSDRAGGNLSRPFFPDGITTARHGPFSKPQGEWSPFSTGIQLDLVYNQIIGHVAFVAGLSGSDVSAGCSNISRSTPGGNVDPIANGIQIFPGSVPIYKDDVLVGGIGVSGDGVDQDDMIALLGVHHAGQITGTLNNAPKAMRADRIVIDNTRLRYVQCPQKPFRNSDQQNVCEGK
jgi:uncharacterized protein GlcG (DUF336 family)